MRVLTGGVPRAVFVAAQYVETHADATPTDDGLARHIKWHCPHLFQRNDDVRLRHLVEMGWAGMEVNPDALADGKEPLSALLSDFGLTASAGSRSALSRIEVPLYLLRCQQWTPASLKHVAQYTEAGERLETGIRRVLFLRLSILDVQTWDGVSLGCLDGHGIPFPVLEGDDEEDMDIFNFPELSGSAHGDMKSAEEFMSWAHRPLDETSLVDPDRRELQPTQQQAFDPSWLKRVSELMRVGHMYVPLPRSRSADAVMRLGDKIKLHWQFKNLREPIDLDTMKEEAAFCVVAGWIVHLVIVCTSGHCANHDGSDFAFNHKGVHVVALSRECVSNFLGPARRMTSRLTY